MDLKLALPRSVLAIKLTAALLAGALPVLLLLALLDGPVLRRAVMEGLQDSEANAAAPMVGFLAQAYGRAGNWEFVPGDPPQFHDWLAGNVNERRAPQSYGRAPPPLPQQRDGLNLERRVALLDAQEQIIVGPPGSGDGRGRWPIRNNGAIVGYLTFVDGDLQAPPWVERVASERRREIWLVSLTALLVSALIASLMARHLLRPVRALAAAAAHLAAGWQDTRLPEDRRDELNQLALCFNQLADALAHDAMIRRQFVADTSHELRTPIAVLRAQIEALQDGIHQADSGTLAVLHQDVMGLSRLVDDLYSLARADAGAFKIELAPIDLVAVIEDVIESFAPRLKAAGLSVDLAGKPPKPWISMGDQRRMRQLFINLIENSTRYTDTGGRLEIRVMARTNTIVLRFDDSAPGVDDSELTRLFERFYRVESSRSRDQGGSGLGLAICQGIVVAHSGQIAASPSPLGGLRIEIVLPRGEELRR